jgi:hypothetical protein
VRPKVDTMVWSKSFGVSDMRDKQGVPCTLPKPYCVIQIAGLVAALYEAHVGVVASTRSPRPLSGIKRTPIYLVKNGVVLRWWPATAGGVVVEVCSGGGRGGAGRISNLKSQIPSPNLQSPNLAKQFT